MDHNQLWFSPNQLLLFLAINHTKSVGTTRFPIFYPIVHSGPCTCRGVPTCPSAHTIGPSSKIPPKNYIVKFVKLIDHIYAYCSLTNFEYEVNETTGYRNYMSLSKTYVPYTRHYNPLLIRNHSWIITIHKVKGHST